MMRKVVNFIVYILDICMQNKFKNKK